MDERHLASLPLFASLDKSELRAIARVSDEIDLPAGKKLIGQGESSYEFFVLEDGGAAVSIDGREVARLGPGDFFGEMGVLGSTMRNATVATTSPATAVVMTGRDLRLLEREMPRLHERLCKAVADRTRAVTADASAG
jgi:CRP/FNR family transcriptional regulator, cyclic AMP receptor protein